MVDTVGLPDVQEMLYKGFELKSDPILKNTGLYPVKNGLTRAIYIRILLEIAMMIILLIIIKL